MVDVAEIAGKLTEAQRGALLDGACCLPAGNQEWSSDCICEEANIAEKLVELGLAMPRERFPGGIVRTPLGLAVRAHLTGEQPSPASSEGEG